MRVNGLAVAVISVLASADISLASPVTITFIDVSNILTVTTSDPTRTTVGCGGAPAGQCFFGLFAPSISATLVGVGTGFNFGIGEPSPSGNVGWATILFTPFRDTNAEIDFILTPPAQSFGCVPSICKAIANGQIQTAFGLTWTDGTVDTVRFQIIPTPEPSTAVLLIAGLLGLGGRLLRTTSQGTKPIRNPSSKPC
jgi:hypothetical protein